MNTTKTETRPERESESREKRPTYVKQEHLEYLDDLRDSGETNMFGARPYLQEEFGIDKTAAGEMFIGCAHLERTTVK